MSLAILKSQLKPRDSPTLKNTKKFIVRLDGFRVPGARRPRGLGPGLTITHPVLSAAEDVGPMDNFDLPRDHGDIDNFHTQRMKIRRNGLQKSP